MKRFRLLIIILMLAIPSLSFAGSFDNFDFGIGVEDYTWTVQANSAIQPKDHGNRLAIFIDYANVKKDDYYFAYAGKIYGGKPTAAPTTLVGLAHRPGLVRVLDAGLSPYA